MNNEKNNIPDQLPEPAPPENKPVSRRQALKYMGIGALGAAGALYGLDRIFPEENIMSTKEEGEIPASSSRNNTFTPGSNNSSMKVLLINGSPRREGNTFIALSEVAASLEKEGIKTTIIQLGTRAVQGCIACQKCKETGQCVFNDQLYAEVREQLAIADGIIIGSPVYYSGPNGSLCSLLDRIFYTSGELVKYKAGAAVAVCRRGGASATLDRLNKYFTISQMLVVGSQYWNMAHGMDPGEIREDKEGLQIMRTLGRNMAWTIKSKQAGQQPLPEEEKRVRTDFVKKF